jgi:hypothetical protein
MSETLYTLQVDLTNLPKATIEAKNFKKLISEAMKEYVVFGDVSEKTTDRVREAQGMLNNQKIKIMTTDSYNHLEMMTDMHGVDAKRKGANTLATVIGVAIALLVILGIFAVWNRNKSTEKNTDKETNINLGETNGEVRALRGQVARLENYERADAMKIAYTDGALFGQSPRLTVPGFPAPYGVPYGLPYGGHGFGGHGHGHHGRGDHDCGCEGHPMKSKFQEVKTFKVNSDLATLTTTC